MPSASEEIIINVPTSHELSRLLRYLRAERDSAELYDALATPEQVVIGTAAAAIPSAAGRVFAALAGGTP